MEFYRNIEESWDRRFTAENSQGIGDGALTMYLEGRLNLSEIKKSSM